MRIQVRLDGLHRHLLEWNDIEQGIGNLQSRGGDGRLPGERQKVASIWLFKDMAFMIKDLSDKQSPVYKYSFESTGRLSNEQKSSLKVLENKLTTYSGEKARITAKTINQLKEMLDNNLQLLIG